MQTRIQFYSIQQTKLVQFWRGKETTSVFHRQQNEIYINNKIRKLLIMIEFGIRF